jgi:glyoxylase-like metal-dependent hydrolase (beta-lactamase superfamily II)
MVLMLIKCLAVGIFQANCYIIRSETSNNGIIIDPGDVPQEILYYIQQSKLNIDYILLTHGHPDHCHALKEIKDITKAKIAIHKNDVKLLHDRTLSLLLGLGYHELPDPDILLVEGDNICLGNTRFKILHTPGHTPGSICIYSDGIVFTGDTLFNSGIGRTDLPGGNSYDIINSIRDKLLKLPDETIVYPGHGPITSIGAERRGNFK